MASIAWLWIGLAFASPGAVPIHEDGAAVAAKILATRATGWPATPPSMGSGHRSRSSDRPCLWFEAGSLIEDGEDDDSSAPREAFQDPWTGLFDLEAPGRPRIPPRGRPLGLALAQRSPILRC